MSSNKWTDFGRQKIVGHPNSFIVFMSATKQQMVEIRIADDNDAVCSQIKKHCLERISPSQPLIKPYWEIFLLSLN